jgi:hypothetical protein
MTYTALVLNEESHLKLMRQFDLSENWQKICHHMTINLGNAEFGPAVNLIGQEFELIATSVAQDERVIAIKVESVVPSNNKIKHVTIAVNPNAGGKSKHSNNLINWTPLLQKITLHGVVLVVD